MELSVKERNMIKEKSKWSAKIGVIYIASSLSIEREWHMALQDDVSFHTARISIDNDSSEPEDIWNMANSTMIEKLSKQLASCEVDVIVFACTAGSFLGGGGWDEKLVKRISAAANGIPSTTTSTGLLEALKITGCKKINMATPYINSISIKEKAFIEESGTHVENFTSEECMLDNEIVRISPEKYASRVIEMYKKSPDVDGTFISCTNSRTYEILELLESKLGITMLSSNQVSLFSALNKIAYKGEVKGYGSLFKYL